VLRLLSSRTSHGLPVYLLAGLKAPSTRQQVEDENDYCKHKQNVNEAAADVKAEAKNPEDEKDDDDRPKHKIVLRSKWSRTDNSASNIAVFVMGRTLW
jgi:hypothetical protein